MLKFLLFTVNTFSVLWWLKHHQQSEVCRQGEKQIDKGQVRCGNVHKQCVSTRTQVRTQLPVWHLYQMGVFAHPFTACTAHRVQSAPVQTKSTSHNTFFGGTVFWAAHCIRLEVLLCDWKRRSVVMATRPWKYRREVPESQLTLLKWGFF